MYYLAWFFLLSCFGLPLYSMDTIMGNDPIVNEALKKSHCHYSSGSGANAALPKKVLSTDIQIDDTGPLSTDGKKIFKKLVHTNYAASYKNNYAYFLLGGIAVCTLNTPLNMVLSSQSMHLFPLGFLPNAFVIGLLVASTLIASDSAERMQLIGDKLSARYFDMHTPNTQLLCAKQKEICKCAQELGGSDATCDGSGKIALLLGLNTAQDIGWFFMSNDETFKQIALVCAALNLGGLLTTFGGSLATLRSNAKQTKKFNKLLKELDALVEAQQEEI